MDEIRKTLTVYSASAGTGKTYTLAARYIALLMDTAGDRGYRHVLAVTFTNKATAEMKQRILSYLYNIGECDADDEETANFVKAVRGFMRRKMSDEDMAQKARKLYFYILEDYDAMQVVTIDSFLHQLVTGMAHTIGVGADFGVELDNNRVIAEAVDETMYARNDDKDSPMQYLVGYVEQRLDDEKNWDVRKNLIAMAKELLKEAVLKDEKKIEFDPIKILRYKNAVSWRKAPEVHRMRELYNQVSECETNNEINGGRNYYAFIKRIGNTLEGAADSDKAFCGLGEKDAERLEGDKFLKKISTRPIEIQQTLWEMQQLCAPCRKAYLSDTITTRYLNDLVMMGFIKKNLESNLQEANTILLASTPNMLYSALKPGDADFILEKAGIRYKHIMIDEFQDTSMLQWAVFRKLIDEILASGGTTLIVGDVKQSIYRWRNGDYSIMQDLIKAGLQSRAGSASMCTGEDAIYNYVRNESLRKNFRSYAKIVDFNLHLFDWLCADGGYAKDFADIYRELSPGWSLTDYCDKAEAGEGYVQLCIRQYSRAKSDKAEAPPVRNEVRASIVEDMFAEIEDLIGRGADMNDILILVRFNNDVRDIVAQYAKSSLEQKGIRLCSNDSFVLESSWSVQTVVNALKVIAGGDKLAATFLTMHGLLIDKLTKDLMRLPLNEMVERVVRLTLFDTQGQMRYNDQAYLNSFLDELTAFICSYGSDVKDFLRYWDDQLHKKAIPASGTDGVRIMTIHSAKGLEKKYVFIPFCDWELAKDRNDSVLWHQAMAKPYGNDEVQMLGLIPAAQKKAMTDTDYCDAYIAEQQAQRIDNLNLLYVALTRAAAHLYIYASVVKKDKDDEIKTVGELLRRYAGCEELTVGEKNIFNEKKKGTSSPLEHQYKADERINYSFCSNDEAIRFRQSQESLIYMQQGADGVERAASRINAGNLRHDIFANILTVDDSGNVIEEFRSCGLIKTHAEAEQIKQDLERAWRNPKMADWFGGGYQVLREVSILRPKAEFDREMEVWKELPAQKRGQMPRRELRPDRVMVRDGKAVVLDFKFGKHNHEKYSRQVEKYMDLLRQMDYTDVEGYLWYGLDGELVKI